MIRTAAKFAVFGAICLGLTLWLAFVIGNVQFADPLNRDNYALTARFDDVTGLLPNDEVKIAGVEVGKVTSITTEEGQALVRFQVSDDYRDVLPVDTSASIRWRNLIGQRFLYLVPGEASTMLEDGDEVCAHESGLCTNDSVADLGALFNRLGPIVSSIDEGQVNDFLETFTQALDGNADRLGQTLADLATLSEGLAGRDAAISSLLEDLNTVAGTLTARDQQIRTLLDNLVLLAQEFSDNTGVVDQALNEFASFSTDLSTLLETNAAEIDAIIANLDSVVDTEVITRLQGLQTALDGLDEATRAVFNAGRYGEWLNQDILCASVAPPPCPTPIDLVDDLTGALSMGASTTDAATGTQNLVELLTGGLG